MIYSFLAIIAGANVAVSIMLNAKLGAIKGLYKGAFINYLMGLLISIPLVLIINGLNFTSVSIHWGDLLALTGGTIGYFVVLLNNHVTPKMGILYVTILLFIGQIGTGSIIDAVRDGSVSVGKILGGLLIITGLVYLVRIEKNPEK